MVLKTIMALEAFICWKHWQEPIHERILPIDRFLGISTSSWLNMKCLSYLVVVDDDGVLSRPPFAILGALYRVVTPF